MEQHTPGWSMRRNVVSIVYHYFREGISICDKHWQDASGPMSSTLPRRSRPCPNCFQVLKSAVGAAMDWKYVTLHCPSCNFAHSFKRVTWFEMPEYYIGLYETDDARSRKDCNKTLLYGEGTYEAAMHFIQTTNYVIAKEQEASESTRKEEGPSQDDQADSETRPL